MASGFSTPIRLALALAALLAGCQSGPEHAQVIGQAYVGPASLKIRADIPLQSATVATVSHGDRLDILIAHRRRFYKVRTASGAEGWTDEQQLMSAAELASLRDLSARAAKLTSQGQAGVSAELRVHMQPARGSPFFGVIKPGSKVDVLADVATPRNFEIPRPPLLPPPPKRPERTASKKQARVPPPPMPTPPPPPANWLELSKPLLPPPEPEAPPPSVKAGKEPEAKPVPFDHWSLIRANDGQAGWVLTGSLQMSIPDEVAQYAEGHRIVSYFSLGRSRQGGESKDTWLWTTVATGNLPYDFDAFRVFVFNPRRGRYETAHVERGLKGYAPVTLQQVQIGSASYPGFSVCAERRGGETVRREYALMGNVIRVGGDAPCQPSTPLFAWQSASQQKSQPTQAAPRPAAPKEGIAARLRNRISGWFRR